MPNSTPPFDFDSDIESFLLSLENLRVVNNASPSLISSSGYSTITTRRRTHERSTMLTAATPLFSERIWSGHSISNGGGDSWGNLQSNRCMRGFDANYQQMTVRENSGSGALSMSIRANQENPVGKNLACIPDGGTALNASQNINALLALQDYDVILLGKTQRGSLSLQKLLSLKDLRITNKIFEAVFKYPFDLMTDEYGQHLFVKLIRSCSDNQLRRITLYITSQSELFYKASGCKNGAQSMQKLIKVLVGSPWISLAISAVHRRFKDMMFNRMASSVIIQCLQTLDDRQIEVLYLAAINCFRDLATNIVGCASLNNFIDDMRGPRRRQLLDLITSHAVFLSKDPSGNFVVQHVIELGDPKLSNKICSLLKGKFVELSLLRCGSHLVEKCLKSPGMAHYIVDDLLEISDHQLLQLARHKYGNYVIQSALRVTKNEDISLHIDLLKKLQNQDALKLGLGRIVCNLIANGIPDEA